MSLMVGIENLAPDQRAHPDRKIVRRGDGVSR
jgi:hypothetical protein